MAAVSAASAGWKTLYLNPNIPVQDIAAAAQQSGARVVGLSIVYAADKESLTADMQLLRKQLPQHVDLMLGGSAAGDLGDFISESGAILLTGFGQVKDVLDRLRSPTSRTTDRVSEAPTQLP